jgi:hypothetical protein
MNGLTRLYFASQPTYALLRRISCMRFFPYLPVLAILSFESAIIGANRA